MNAPPAREPLIILPPQHVTGTPRTRWAQGTGAHAPAAVVELGTIAVYVYSKAHAAQLKEAFAEAERLHDAAERGQR